MWLHSRKLLTEEWLERGVQELKTDPTKLLDRIKEVLVGVSHLSVSAAERLVHGTKQTYFSNEDRCKVTKTLEAHLNELLSHRQRAYNNLAPEDEKWNGCKLIQGVMNPSIESVWNHYSRGSQYF
jgi:hypothetical protein